MEKVLRFFLPDPSTVSNRERYLSAFLAFLATLISVFISSLMIDVSQAPVFVASIGAAAVLVFAAPKSPLSQPWPLIGGHLVSASIGVFCYQNIPSFMFAVAMAVGLAILLMYLLRCLHPPGGAAALSVVLGSAEIQAMGYEYVFTPVAVNIVVLLLTGMLLNNLVPGRRYPIEALNTKVNRRDEWATGRATFDQADIESAIREMDSFLDISHADLNRIYRIAVRHANQRRVGDVRCQDIMSKDVFSVEFGATLEEVWHLLNSNKLKALPVVDRFSRVVGIVTVSDFVKHAQITDQDSMAEKIKSFLRVTEGENSNKPEVVGQIMSEPATTVPFDEHVINVVSLFTEKNIHHLPVLNEKKVLVGMITRSDVMRALALLRI